MTTTLRTQANAVVCDLQTLASRVGAVALDRWTPPAVDLLVDAVMCMEGALIEIDPARQ